VRLAALERMHRAHPQPQPLQLGHGERGQQSRFQGIGLRPERADHRDPGATLVGQLADHRPGRPAPRRR
jgi:hypothetical protein